MNRRKWPLLADCALALTFVALGVLELFTAVDNYGMQWPPAWKIVLLLITPCLLVLRRRFPRTIFMCVLAATTTLTAVDLPLWVAGVSVYVMLYTLGAYTALGWVITGAVLTLGLITAAIVMATGPVTVGDILSNVTTVVITAILGRVRRLGILRAAQLEQALRLLGAAQASLAAEAVEVERGRIARELHDIVSHGLSVIAVRAGVGRALFKVDPSETEQAVTVIEKVARESLAEMRHMLGALRSGDEDGTTQPQPQPGLNRLDELIETVRSSGLPVEVVRNGQPQTLPPGHELAAYRIVQEALTNVLKHAGTVRSIVTLSYLPDRLVIDVFNDAPPGPSVRPGRGGHGLIGMRERVRLYGGTLHASQVRDGFRVTAELPLHESPSPVGGAAVEEAAT